MSGASTMFTKSNSPSVAHWWSTLQPSSSTSALTCRRRSGFDLMVWTPCCVSVERRMKIGIAASPSVDSPGPYPGRLVDIQQCAAEVEERAEDDVGDEMGDALAVLALRPQERDQRQLGDADDDDQRRQRAERVDVVGGAEPPAAAKRVTEAEVLDHRGRDGEPEEREPRDPRQHDEADQERDRCEDERGADERGHGRAGVERQHARPDERRPD